MTSKKNTSEKTVAGWNVGDVCLHTWPDDTDPSVCVITAVRAGGQSFDIRSNDNRVGLYVGPDDLFRDVRTARKAMKDRRELRIRRIMGGLDDVEDLVYFAYEHIEAHSPAYTRDDMREAFRRAVEDILCIEIHDSETEESED